jgi:hypothetical protein
MRILNDMAAGGRVAMADLIEEVSKRLPRDPEKRDKRREHVMQALNGLLERGAVTIENNEVGLPGDPQWEELA